MEAFTVSLPAKAIEDEVNKGDMRFAAIYNPGASPAPDLPAKYGLYVPVSAFEGTPGEGLASSIQNRHGSVAVRSKVQPAVLPPYYSQLDALVNLRRRLEALNTGADALFRFAGLQIRCRPYIAATPTGGRKLLTLSRVVVNLDTFDMEEFVAYLWNKE